MAISPHTAPGTRVAIKNSGMQYLILAIMFPGRLPQPNEPLTVERLMPSECDHGFCAHTHQYPDMGLCISWLDYLDLPDCLTKLQKPQEIPREVEKV